MGFCETVCDLARRPANPATDLKPVSNAELKALTSDGVPPAQPEGKKKGKSPDFPPPPAGPAAKRLYDFKCTIIVVNNTLVLVGIPSTWQRVVVGAFILLAAAFFVRRAPKPQKRKAE